MKDMPHGKNIRLGKRIIKEVSWIEAQPLAKSKRVYIFIEEGFGNFQVKTSS